MILEENNKIKIINYIIYGIIIKNTNKFYIGQTNNFIRRKNEHRWAAGRKTMPIDMAIKKYGKDSFDMFIIQECNTVKELNEAEIFWIEYYKSIGATLYNIKKGGKGRHEVSEEMKQRLRKIFKGRKLAPVSKETREAISKANTGKKQTIETINKRIESIKKTRSQPGYIKYKPSQELTKIFVDNNKKQIISIDEFDNIQEFESITDAAKKLNLKREWIYDTLNNKRKQCHGYIFSYINKKDEEKRINKKIEIEKNKPPRLKGILVIDKFGNERKFNSINRACIILDLSISNVEKFLYGNTKKNNVKGYTFKYLDENSEKLRIERRNLIEHKK